MASFIPRFLRQLKDILISSPTDGQVLTYDSADQKWKNEAGGGGGAPTTADYLVGTSQAGLSAEIVVGATPGGELGGTWAAPTVDATHSGSTHAAVQAAAEATGAGALASHEADTTNIHGITNTANLLKSGDAAGGVLGGTYPNPSFAADMATQAELDAHVNDTTDAHDASAVSFVPTGTIAATDVQTAIAEVASEASGGTPGGSDTQVQYNNGGAFGGAAGFTFNDATGAVSISPSADDVEALVEVTAPAGFVATSVEASLLTLISEGADRVYVFDAHGDFYINGAVDEGVSQIALNSIDYPGEFVMRSGADGVPFLRAADASDNTIFAVAGTTTIDPTLALGDVFSVDSGGIFYALTSGGVWSAVEIYGDTGEVSNLLGLFRGSDQTIVFSVGPTGYVEMPEQTAPSAPAANNTRIFVRDSGGVTQLCARFATGDIMVLGQQGVTTQTYTESNVTTDRTYNANATTIDELSDVLGTLIADLRAKGVVA